MARRPNDESRTEHRLRSLQPASPSEGETTQGPPEPRSALGQLFWQKLLHESLEVELAPLHAAIERLEAKQTRDAESAPSEALLAQIGELRARSETLAAVLDAQVQAGVHRQEHLEDELTRRLLIQTQVQERLFSQLQQEQRTIARAVHDLADAHTALLDHLETALDASQRRLLATQERTRRLEFAFGLLVLILVGAVLILRFAAA